MRCIRRKVAGGVERQRAAGLQVKNRFGLYFFGEVDGRSGC